MARERILVNELLDGMKLAEDVLTQEGQLLVAKGATITSKTIAKLKFYEVLYVYIESKIAEKPKETSYYKRIESTYEFKKFNHTLRKGVQTLEEILKQSILYNEEIDTKDIVSSLEDIVSDARNGMHLMNMLQCIRSYDDLTYVHSINVALIANVIGGWLHMSEEEKNLLTIAGVLHDIGKTIIPEEILTKTTKLTDDEFELLRSHTLKGYDLLKGKNLDKRVKLTALQHHERCDGTGYPLGLTGENICDFAKIIAIADVYDAMTASRVYRQGICPFDVIETLQYEGLQKYDPKFLLPFLENISQCYIHTNIMLSDGREGEVIMLNRNQLARPVVKVGDSYINLAENPGLSIKSLL